MGRFVILKFDSTTFQAKNILPLLLRVDRGSTVVNVPCYKSEGRWFDPSWCHWKDNFVYANYGVRSQPVHRTATYRV